MAILTLKQLEQAGACSEQRELFARMFGASVDVNPSLCVSVADKFSWGWAASNLLLPAALAEYKRVRGAALAEYMHVRGAAFAEYTHVRDAALAEYWRVRDAAIAEYKRVCGAAFAEYKRVCGAAFAEYARVSDAAQAEYTHVRAETFGRLYDLQGV